MDKQGSLLVGLMWGTSLSIPLWLAVFGWAKLMIGFLVRHNLI